jgi:hypothetical protein
MEINPEYNFCRIEFELQSAAKFTASLAVLRS